MIAPCDSCECVAVAYVVNMTAPAAFVNPIPAALADAEAAPLLCAGLIMARWRTLRMMREAHEEAVEESAYPEAAIPATGDTP